MSARLLAAYRWFRQAGIGGIAGQDAQNCLALARAELTAKDAGCSWEWQDDADGWEELRVNNYRCSCGCGARIESCEACILRDEDGNVLASLWAIWDASESYRRVIQAELALEAMDSLLSYAI